ncbi:MAG: FG-GAP repeat domain-containing protein, partial [Planctomycetota bacterium]
MAHPAHHPARAIPVDRSRRTAVLAVALAVTLVCNGCLAGIIGGLLPLLLNGSGGSTNSAPVISIGAISRTSGQVAVPITVVDADADNVTLTVEFDAGSGYMPGTATPGSVTGSLNGTAAVLNWNAPVDLGSTAWVGGVLIRITPADGTTTGTPVTSDPFDFGNDAPVLTAVSVDTDAQNKVSGNAVVRFTVADTSADTISVKTFEYSLLGDFSDAMSVPLTTSAGANFPSGSLSNLPSTSGGTNHSFTWNSYLTAPVSAAGAKVRITLRDQGALDSTTEESPAFDLANSTFVEIGAIARTSGVVSVPLTVYNSASLMVTLSVEYDIGGGFVATANTTPAQIPGTPGGNAGVLMWDAPTDLGSTAFVSGVVLRISPDDGVAPGPQEVSDPFDFGNDPPVVQTLGVDGNPVSGNVVVRFTISDNSADSVSLADFQYSLLGDFSDAVSVPLTTGGAGNFPSGTLTGLPTTAGGIEHAITWNSLLTADFAQTGAKIRLRVTDVPGLTSAYTPSAGFDLANGDPHPPIAQIIAVKRADPGGLRTGVVLIDYRVIDDDADQIDVKVEYSIDDKQSWLPCSEYPSARSEGRYDLASSPSGVRHRFVWDAESDLGGETPSVHFRVSPAAIDGIGLEAETSIDIAVGAPGGVEAFSPLQDIAVGNAPIHLAAADLDRNGTIDLAVVLNGGNAVRILPGKGDGTFTTGATVAVGSGPLAVAIGDINNDNVPDLAVSNFNDDTISLLIGDGEGGFSSGGTLATGDQPRHVLLADFNTDGKLDIACTEGNATNLMVGLGNGDGTFGSATANATANSPRQVIAADVNNDGNLDLLIACNTGNRVRTLLGVGNGTFTSASNTNVANQPTSLTTRYFNGDSNIDLAVVSTRFNNQQIQILPGNGNGTFSASALPLSGGDEPIWI